jgi:hypothetical protein
MPVLCLLLIYSISCLFAMNNEKNGRRDGGGGVRVTGGQLLDVSECRIGGNRRNHQLGNDLQVGSAVWTPAWVDLDRGRSLDKGGHQDTVHIFACNLGSSGLSDIRNKILF